MLHRSRVFTIFFLFLLGAASGHAQQIALPDSLRTNIDTLLTIKVHTLDSIQEAKDRTIDSVVAINKSVDRHIDQLKQVSESPSLSLDTSSIMPSTVFQKTDSVRNRLISRLDSLSGKGLSPEPFTKPLDSLSKISPLGNLNELEGKLASVESDVQEKLDQPIGKVNEKLGQLRGEAGGEGNLPRDVSSPTMQPLDLSEKLPDVQSQMPEVDLPGVNADGLTGDLNVDLEDKLGDTGQLAGMDKIQDGIGEASSVTGKVSGYAEDAKNIGTGNLDDVQQIDKDIAAKVEVDETTALQENSEMLESHKQMVASLKNQEAFKEQVQAKAREMVAKQIASQQAKITEAVDKLSKHQKRAGTVFNKVKGLPKRPRKEKKPPLIERFVPGITLQIQRSELWFVDFNPTLRYRMRSIFSTGIGWNERVIFDSDFQFYNKTRVYGVRSFAELSVLKGLWLRGDVERMNAFIPLNPMQHDIGERKTVWCYLAGVKKEFSFAPGVTGNVQFMYNLYDPDKTSPYFNKFNVRFGFDFPLKIRKD